MPQRDEGGGRVERFFASVRITRPMPSEPAPPSGGAGGALAGSEVIPPWWDRVRLPGGSAMTLLMPQWTAPGPFPRDVPELVAATVSRGLITADGDEMIVAAYYASGKSLGSEVVAALAIGAENRVVTVGGYPARLSFRDFSGVRMASLAIDLGGQKIVYVLFTGAKVDANSPEVKRVIDSISFTLQPKLGPEPPEGPTAPPWTRRFAAGGTFSAELPGRSGAVNEAAVGLGPGLASGSLGHIPLRDRKQIQFVVTGIGIAAPNPPNPWNTIEMEIQRLRSPKAAMQFVRRADVGGRPGFVSARTDKNGNGTVQMKIQDVVMAYTLTVAGPGVTPDTPEVKRCLESASFAITPNGPPPKAEAAPEWARRPLDGSGFSVEMPPAPPGLPAAPLGKLKVGAPINRTELGQMPDGKGGVLNFSASFVGKVRPTDPGPPPDLDTGGVQIFNIMQAAKAQPELNRSLLTQSVQGRAATRVVSGEKTGGPVVVRMYLGEGDRLYTLQVEGRGISESTLEVFRFFGTVRFDDPPR
jgi:hypothetical protein